MRVRPRTLTLAAAGVAATLTLLITVLPFVKFTYRSLQGHVALQTAEAVIAVVVAFLIYGRFRERRLLSDLLLIYGLVVLATVNLLSSVIPDSAFGSAAESYTTWAPALGRLVGAAAVALASLGPARTLRGEGGATLATFGAIATVLTIGVAVFLARGALPVGVDPLLSPHRDDVTLVSGRTGILWVQLVSMALFALAAVGFTRRATAGDEMMTWFGPAATFSAFARLNFFLYPSLYTDYVYTGDLLRLLSYVLLLVGASSEIRNYWKRLELDLVERNNLVEQLRHLALVDQLTGLNNRRSFHALGEHQLKLTQRAGKPLFVLFIDLNGMKLINDRSGHQVGDEAIKETADVLRETFRASDILARLAGDEFCVMLPGLHRDDLQVVRDRLQRNADLRNRSGGRSYQLSFSVGAAEHDAETCNTVDALLEAADRAMYEDKQRFKVRREARAT
ncbi:MAG TPA: GGDEF domain-containing protein [Actinomycetota bacterium]|nr:GGDEF domain-containing protein [Actinomycetota bacterium]